MSWLCMNSCRECGNMTIKSHFSFPVRDTGIDPCWGWFGSRAETSLAWPDPTHSTPGERVWDMAIEQLVAQECN